MITFVMTFFFFNVLITIEYLWIKQQYGNFPSTIFIFAYYILSWAFNIQEIRTVHQFTFSQYVHILIWLMAMSTFHGAKFTRKIVLRFLQRIRSIERAGVYTNRMCFTSRELLAKCLNECSLCAAHTLVSI